MDLDFMEKIEKEREYKDYVVDHIEKVESNFNRLIVPLKGHYNKEVDQAIDLCGQLVPLHDLSKFSKYEFDAYRAYHYPVSDEEKKAAEEDYQWAWEHHRSVNPHHPYFWTKLGYKEDMPLPYIFEMLCDWSAVSQHMAEDHGSKDSVVDWYDLSAKDEKALFSEKTRKAVDFWVDEIFRKPGVRF